MTASDHLQPEQLKLFMTGTEWKSTLTHSSDGPLQEKMEQSLAQAKAPASSSVHGAGIYDSLKAHGYRTVPGSPPATIVFEDSPNGKELRRVQSEGHHRVAAAAALEEDTKNDEHPRTIYIPTNYVDTTAGARARYKQQHGESRDVYRRPPPPAAPGPPLANRKIKKKING